MNEEEKKTFKFLKDIYELNFKSCTLENIDIKNIVNIIEKQQKEIENRLDEINCLYKFISIREERIDELVEINEKYNDLYISKDKIKEKIKEVENREENYTFDKLTSEDIRRTIITNLEELLGKTND